jgi:hypothetical protein
MCVLVFGVAARGACRSSGRRGAAVPVANVVTTSIVVVSFVRVVGIVVY